MKATVQIRKRFQVTVPESVRTAYGLEEDDFIEIDIIPVKKDIYWRNNAAKDERSD